MRGLQSLMQGFSSAATLCKRTAGILLVVCMLASAGAVAHSAYAQTVDNGPTVSAPVENGTGTPPANAEPEKDKSGPIIIAGIDLTKLDLERLLKFDGEYIAELIDQIDLTQVTYDQVMTALKTSVKTLLVLLVSVGGIVISILGFVLFQLVRVAIYFMISMLAQRHATQNRRTLPLAGMNLAPTVKNFDTYALERAERGNAYRDLLTDIKRRLGHLKEKLQQQEGKWATVHGLYETSPRFQQVRKDLDELVGLRDHVRNEISQLIHARKARLGIIDANMELMRHYADSQGFFHGFWRKRVMGFKRIRFHGFKLWMLPRFTTLGGDRRITKRISQFNVLENECVRLYNILVEEFSSFADTLKVRMGINLSMELPQPMYVVSGESLVSAEVADPFDAPKAAPKTVVDAPAPAPDTSGGGTPNT
ncbi:MAG: hypothetical protein GC134_07770 [Proteobacteria bacterium]|nr:hypothetical protein [Pseudomonadota bacterium]